MRTLTTYIQAYFGTLHKDNERGVTTVEYAIMLVLVAIAVAASQPGIKNAIINTFNTTASVLNAGAVAP